MVIGTPREIKDNERRVALTPDGVNTLVRAGHVARIERGAGEGSGFGDDEYRAAGAQIEPGPAAIWAADLVLKVKEPLPEEYGYLREELLLFTFLHLAAEPVLTAQLLSHRVTGIAYETVQAAGGDLPILEPMSEVAGSLAPQVAAQLLTHVQGGRGKLLGGIAGVPPGRVAILGAGSVGTHAARIAVGLGAQVTVFNRGLARLRALDAAFAGRITTLVASPAAIAQAVETADVVIGAVLVPGGRAPRLVTDDMVASMQPGAVIVDVAVDQGGSVETIRPTSHSHPTYLVHGVVHYAVPNMPGSVPHTSTIALTNATLPYVLQLAAGGFERAIAESPDLAAGVNTYRGAVTNPGVAQALGHAFAPLKAR